MTNSSQRISGRSANAPGGEKGRGAHLLARDVWESRCERNVAARKTRVALVALVWLVGAGAAHAQPATGGPARIYVRRIEFVGLVRTEDETLRRELTQLEGTF